MGMKCGTCKYFDGSEVHYGHCHRYAPKPKLGDASSLSMVIFPYLHATKWCGEWESNVTELPYTIREDNDIDTSWT